MILTEKFVVLKHVNACLRTIIFWAWTCIWRDAIYMGAKMISLRDFDATCICMLEEQKKVL